MKIKGKQKKKERREGNTVEKREQKTCEYRFSRLLLQSEVELHRGSTHWYSKKGSFL